jgi:hypothetical protein
VSSQASIPDKTNFSYKAMTLTNLCEDSSQTSTVDDSNVDQSNIDDSNVDQSKVDDSNIDQSNTDNTTVNETIIAADTTLKHEESKSAHAETEAEVSTEMKIIRKYQGVSKPKAEVSNENNVVSSPDFSASHDEEDENAEEVDEEDADEDADEDDSETLLASTQALIGGSPLAEEMPDTSPILETPLKEELAPKSEETEPETKDRSEENVDPKPEEDQTHEVSPTKRGRGRPSAAKPKPEVAKPEVAKPEEVQTPEASPIKRGRGRPSVAKAQPEVAKLEITEPEETKIQPSEGVEDKSGEVQTPLVSPTKQGRGRPPVVKAKPEAAKPDETNIRRSGRATRPSTKISGEDFVSDPFIHDLPISPTKRSASQKSEPSGLDDVTKMTPAKSPRGRKPKVAKPDIVQVKNSEENLSSVEQADEENAESPSKGKKRGRKPSTPKVSSLPEPPKSPAKKAKRAEEVKVVPPKAKGGRGRRSQVVNAPDLSNQPSTSSGQVEKKEASKDSPKIEKSSSKEDHDLSLDIDLPVRVGAVTKTYSRKTKTYIEAEEDYILEEILEYHPPNG